MPEKDEFERYNQKNDTLFRACLTSSDLPPEEKHMERLAQEAFTIIAAGGETTARLLTVSTFYTLLHKERILPRLREELKSVMPSPNTPLDWKTAEQLPWLVSFCPPKNLRSMFATNQDPRPLSSRKRSGSSLFSHPGFPSPRAKRSTTSNTRSQPEQPSA